MQRKGHIIPDSHEPVEPSYTACEHQSSEVSSVSPIDEVSTHGEPETGAVSQYSKGPSPTSTHPIVSGRKATMGRIRSVTAHRLRYLRRIRNLLVYFPFVFILLVIAVSIGLIMDGYWRRGTTLMGCDALFAGFVRLSTKDVHAGLLMVTSRVKDCIFYFGVGAAIIYLSLTVQSLQ